VGHGVTCVIIACVMQYYCYIVDTNWDKPGGGGSITLYVKGRTMNRRGYTFRDSQQAFQDAIDKGTLSTDNNADNFAGHYMYMHTSRGGVDAFKNINTRQYITS